MFYVEQFRICGGAIGCCSAIQSLGRYSVCFTYCTAI